MKGRSSKCLCVSIYDSFRHLLLFRTSVNIMYDKRVVRGSTYSSHFRVRRSLFVYIDGGRHI